MEMRNRSPHIHDCVRRDIAQRLLVQKSDLQYCYECMTWCPKAEWRDHCNCHLQSWSDRHCEVIVYRHTVVHPGYCPCCLWNQELPADDRLKYWLYSADLRNHVEENHIGKVEWPTSEPICGCSQSFKSDRDFRYHLHDVHKLADGIWKSRRVTSKRKRAAKESACVDEKAQEPKPKEIKFRHYNPPNQCLQTVDSHERPTIIQTLAPVPMQTNFTFCGYPCPSSYSSGVTSGSSASESNTADASASTSPLSSLRTTPDLELIDPRILDPHWVGNSTSTAINETCGASDPVACSNNGDMSIIHEEMTDDLAINHLDTLRLGSLDQERSGTTAIQNRWAPPRFPTMSVWAVLTLVQWMRFQVARFQDVGGRLHLSTISVKPHPPLKGLWLEQGPELSKRGGVGLAPAYLQGIASVYNNMQADTHTCSVCTATLLNS